MYSESVMAHKVKLHTVPYILHQTPITASSKVNRTPRSNSYKRTRCSSNANTVPVPFIHSTNEDQCKAIIDVAMYSESIMAHKVKLHTVPHILHRTPITASIKVNRTPRSNSYKRTFCSSNANTVPVPYIRPTKANASHY